MAVFVNLDDVAPFSGFPPRINETAPPAAQAQDANKSDSSARAAPELETRANPNMATFSAALACYPIVSSLVRSIDLNTLHALSLTGRQIRANLLQHRALLVRQTLRCANDQDAVERPPQPSGSAEDEAVETPKMEKTRGRLTSGRVSACARDLVSECRRCGKATCRNCTLKPPSPSALPARHRPLCSTCLAAPPPPAANACICATATHICLPCGVPLAATDGMYARVLAWRERYSAYYGVGEGGGGARCWQGSRCAGREELEVEFEVSDEGGEDEGHSRREDEGGYLRREVEGIGGVVKGKGWKKVRLGGRVDGGGGGEAGGRGWCGWCERFILGKDERG